MVEEGGNATKVRVDGEEAEDRNLFGDFVLKASVLAKSQDRYVVVRHTDESGGEWTVPGGLVEPDEPIEAAAIRETKEETGLDVTLGRALAIIKARIVSPSGGAMGYLRLVFQASVTGGIPAALDRHEIADVKLATAQEIGELVKDRRFQSLPGEFEDMLVTFLRQLSTS